LVANQPIILLCEEVETGELAYWIAADLRGDRLQQPGSKPKDDSHEFILLPRDWDSSTRGAVQV